LQSAQTFNLVVVRKKAVGLFEQEWNAFINLYPNPTSGNNTLAFTLQTNENLTVSITDLQGKDVLNTVDVEGHSGINEIELPTGGIKDGIYFVTIRSNGKSDKIKLVVIH
jgi:hypothetical protein